MKQRGRIKDTTTRGMNVRPQCEVLSVKRAVSFLSEDYRMEEQNVQRSYRN